MTGSWVIDGCMIERQEGKKKVGGSMRSQCRIESKDGKARSGSAPEIWRKEQVGTLQSQSWLVLRAQSSAARFEQLGWAAPNSWKIKHGSGKKIRWTGGIVARVGRLYRTSRRSVVQVSPRREEMQKNESKQDKVSLSLSPCYCRWCRLAICGSSSPSPPIDVKHTTSGIVAIMSASKSSRQITAMFRSLRVGSSSCSSSSSSSSSSVASTSSCVSRRCFSSSQPKRQPPVASSSKAAPSPQQQRCK